MDGVNEMLLYEVSISLYQHHGLRLKSKACAGANRPALVDLVCVQCSPTRLRFSGRASSAGVPTT